MSINLALFQRFTLREKWLISISLWVIVSIWFLSLFKNGQALNQRWQADSQLKSAHQLILEREPAYDQRFQALAERFNIERTLDETELRNHLESIARELDLSYSLTSRAPRKEGNFSLYEVSISLNAIEMEKLLDFYQSCLVEAPYIRLDSLSLSPNPRNRLQNNARFVFKSFEMEPQLLGL
jgi:hypothetical protein